MAKEIKKEEQKAEKSLFSTAQVGDIFESDTVAYGEHLKLKEQEEKDIIADIENHIDNVIAQRQELKIEQEWQEAIDLHDGVVDPEKDYPFEGAHNLHIHITSMTDNILLEKCKKRTFVRPMMLARPKPQLQKSDMFVLQKKERFISDKTYNEMKIEEALDPIYADAIKLGTGIGKLIHTRDIKPVRTLQVYDPTIEDIARFTEDFSDDKGKQDYKDNLKLLNERLKNKEKDPVTVWVEEDKIMKFQPELKWVDPFNLYIDCYLPEISSNRIIAEKIPDISWKDLKAYFENGYFNKNNKSVLDDIEKKYKQNSEYKKMKYTLIEAIYKYEYKGKNEIDTIITYVKEMPTKVARAISFPYITNKPNYILYKIMNKRKSIYGTGIPKLLKDTNIAINEYWNLQLDAAEFVIAPMMIGNIASPDFDPSTKKFGPATVWWLGANDKITPFPNAHNLSESYKVIEYLQRYAEYISGVSAYMSGRESPMDPNAPASKAYMLLQESNLRINAYIRKIDYSNVELFDQISDFYFQHYNDSIKYFKAGDDKDYVSEDISRKELGTPAIWIPQLSDITVNKALEKEENMQMASFLQAQPAIQQLPEAQRKIIEIVLRGQGGEWEKALDIMLPSSKESDIVNKIVEIMKVMQPQQIVDIMAKIMQSSQSAQASAHPAMGGAPAEAQMANPMDNMPTEGSV